MVDFPPFPKEALIRQLCTALAIEQHCPKHIGFFHSLSVLQEDLYSSIYYIVREPAEKAIAQDHVCLQTTKKAKPYLS